VTTNHSLTSREITQLGGREHQYRCACGITVTHPDAQQARAGINAYHAALMAGDA
jgi:hypothetical protein